jgi:hypothetical protein
MESFKNEFLNIPGKKEEPKRELTPDEEMAEYFESSKRFESGNFEKINSGGLLNQKQKKDDNFAHAKEKLSKMVKSFIDENPDFTNEQKEQQLAKFTEALELAMKIHSDQKPRPDGPYVNHILRVSTRIIEEYGIKDLELVIAALLHDSVEDQSEKLANLAINDKNIPEREKALLFIGDNFGERVKNTVFKLTNLEHEDKSISQDQKNKVYLEHVKEAIEDPDVLPIKLADFSDNALNLESVKETERRLKLSHKYLPVIEVFIERLERAQDAFSQEKITEIKNNLLFAVDSTKDFINNQEKTASGVESPKKIGGDGSRFGYDVDNGKMEFINWQALLMSMSEFFSNPEFMKSIEEGKYNLLIADDTSARVPSLIFNKVIKEVYSKNNFPDPKVLFVPGQMRSTDPNISVKISNHINKYLEKVGLSNTEINALVITDTIYKGTTIKKLSDALTKSNINCDIVTFSFEGGGDEEKQQLENSLGSKIYTTSEMAPSTFGVPYSQGVKKYPGDMVSQKIPGVQNHINQARQMVDKISKRIIEQINGGKTTVVGDSEYVNPMKFIEQYWN